MIPISDDPSNTILSERWEDEEIRFQDMRAHFEAWDAAEADRRATQNQEQAQEQTQAPLKKRGRPKGAKDKQPRKKPRKAGTAGLAGPVGRPASVSDMSE